MTRPELSPPQLRVRTVEIADPGPLQDAVPADDAFVWVRRGEGVVGWGEAVRYKPGSLTEAQDWWSELVANVAVESVLPGAPAGSGLIAFGSFLFDPGNTAAAASLVVPRTVIGRRDGVAWRTEIDSGAAPVGEPQWARPRSPGTVRFETGGLDEAAWQQAVAEAVRRIGRGLVGKVVLARDVLASTEHDIDPRWLAARLAEDYPQCWTYAVDGLVGATPELLVRREAGLITSRVLAGTIGRADGHHLTLAATLAGSGKDLEEHEYAVRSVARALAPYCSGMNVPDAPYVLELPNVLHLATDVTAAAAPGASSLALAAALHPSAAVCGTPTDAARDLIAELEHLDRERYAGPVGWIDAAGDGEWAIALRCGQLDQTDPRLIRLFAGCGIVAGSDPAAELAESNAKLVPMMSALTG